jgi:hypothetical protein
MVQYCTLYLSSCAQTGSGTTGEARSTTAKVRSSRSLRLRRIISLSPHPLFLARKLPQGRLEPIPSLTPPLRSQIISPALSQLSRSSTLILTRHLGLRLRAMSSTALPPLADEHAVPPSPSRVVISLAPLPSNDPSTNPAPPTAAPTMLQDYLQRLSRFEPRMRRYTVSKLSEVDEPVGAFSGGSSVMSSPPLGVIGAPEVAQDKGLLAGYSLGDLEQLLLNAAPSWWKGKSAEGEGSSSRDDEQGLDVDLSEIFGHTTISSPQLGHDDDEEEEEEGDGTGPGLFLNYYSADSLITLFKSTGILSALAAKGFNHPSLIFDTSDSFQHRLSLVDSSLFKANGGAQLGSNDRYLLDLYMKRRETWGLDAMVSYQLMKRLVKAGGWEELREVTGGEHHIQSYESGY